MIDNYLTIRKSAKGIYKDKGSKFLAFAYPVNSEQEAQQIVKALKKAYHDARHHCYAYRLGADKQQYRTNDDGEPSNSAGPPILGQIQAADLTNVLIVVVRYFGGTLLGVSGLINAYRSAAANALQNAKIVEETVYKLIEVIYDYTDTNVVMRIVKDEALEQVAQSFEAQCTLTLNVPYSRVCQVIGRFKHLQQVDVRTIP